MTGLKVVSVRAMPRGYKMITPMALKKLTKKPIHVTQNINQYPKQEYIGKTLNTLKLPPLICLPQAIINERSLPRLPISAL